MPHGDDLSNIVEDMDTSHQQYIFRYVINSYGRESFYVRRCIESIARQKFVHEIILIDQNERPLDLSDLEQKYSLLTKINFQNKSVSSARNKLPKSDSPESSWIIFCDDDGYLDPKYSENLWGAIVLNNKAKIIAGSIIRDDNYDFYSPRHKLGGNLNKFRNSKLLMGSNFCIKEDTFFHLGQFSSNFGIGSYWGSGEETDLTWKAYFSKVPMFYDSTLRVYHVRPNFGPMKMNIKKSFQYGVGKGALVLKWLLIEKKPIVFYELIEMLMVPIVKSIYLFIRLEFRAILFPLSSLLGRIIGTIKGLMNHKKLLS